MDSKLPIRSLDYTVIFARQMQAMREFYGSTLELPLHKELGPQWLEFQVGSNILALTERGVTIISGPTDQPWGHRTLFFRDPDGNVLEIYAEI